LPPLPKVFQSITLSIQHILPSNQNMKFRVDIQNALALIHFAYNCKVIFTWVIFYVLISRADEHASAVTENQAKVDKILDAGIQYIKMTLEYQSP
jgi:hypothetical protein